MGCAFSHTEQIFIIDHQRGNTLRPANNGIGFLGHVRKALANAPQVHVTAHWLIASKETDNDIVLVGHLKTNGLHRQQRISSENVRFIEHRAKIRSTEEKEEWGQPKVPKSPSSDKLRKLSKTTQGRHHTSSVNFGLVDFRKRLERVRRLNLTDGDEEEGQMPKGEEEGRKNNGTNANNERTAADGVPKKGRQQEPAAEAMIIKHRTTMDEEEGDCLDDELFCDWDTLSAECCSIQMPIVHCRTSATAGDGCSEASFVLVKKRLKVAWEHHQIVQVRRQSLARRADANNNNNNGTLVSSNHCPMKNTWMPDIAPDECHS